MDLSLSTIAQTLPYDMLERIFKKRSLQEVRHLRLVCRHWRNCVNDYYKTVNVLCLTGYSTSAATIMEISQMKHSMDLDLAGIVLNQINFNSRYVPNQQLAAKLVKLFPNLTELHIIDIAGGLNMAPFMLFCEELFRSLTGLKKLLLKPSCSNKIMHSIVRNLHFLDTLILLNPNFSLYQNNILFLRRMKKLGFPHHDVIIQHIQRSSSLETLSFKRSVNYGSLIQNLTPNNFPNLKHVSLFLSYSTRTTVDSLLTLLTQLPGLQSLTISANFRCRPILKLLAKQIDHFRALQTIYLQIANVKDKNMMFSSFIRHLPIRLAPIETGSRLRIVIESRSEVSIPIISTILRGSRFTYSIEAEDVRSNLCKLYASQ